MTREQINTQTVTWLPITQSAPPNGVLVLTKIDDGGGERNVQRLRRNGRLWFVPSGDVYVYYDPTHFAWLEGGAL